MTKENQCCVYCNCAAYLPANIQPKLCEKHYDLIRILLHVDELGIVPTMGVLHELRRNMHTCIRPHELNPLLHTVGFPAIIEFATYYSFMFPGKPVQHVLKLNEEARCLKQKVFK